MTKRDLAEVSQEELTEEQAWTGDGSGAPLAQSLHCITGYPKHYLTAISTCSFVPDLSGSGKRA